MPHEPRTVSLVLGSGGARGLAHIGVIHWLTENGYEIRSIAGTSMGALVGGIHATGKLDIYAEWVLALERMDVLRLLDPTMGRAGIFKGERIIKVLRELIGERDIESLPISYTAVATDLDSGQEVWLRSGRLFDAIRASIATPMVFTPFRHGDRTLIDGAVVNPVPVTAALAEAHDLTVAVDLSGPPERRPALAATPGLSHADRHRQGVRRFLGAARPTPQRKLPSRGLLDVAFAAMQSMHDTIAELKLSSCAPDLIIEVPRNACGFFEFWRAEELIALGRERAAAAFSSLST